MLKPSLDILLFTSQLSRSLGLRGTVLIRELLSDRGNLESRYACIWSVGCSGGEVGRRIQGGNG